MEIPKGYSLGKKLRIPLQMFWDDQDVVPKDRRYYGHPFRTYRRLTRGDPVYPTFFNIVVDEVLTEVMMEV